MDDLASLTDSLRLLGDTSRLRILSLLGSEELTVGELSSILDQRQSTISSQLARLREAGLVQDRRHGTRSYYRMHRQEQDGQELWQLLEARLAEDPLLAADKHRMEQVVLARASGAWVDRVAGSLDRRYVPGRGWEAVAASLALILELGDCVDMGSGDGALLDLLAPASESLLCIDTHEGMIESGRIRAREGKFDNVRFLRADMSDPGLVAESADTVLFLQSLQYARDPRKAIRVAASLLREDGKCLVLTLGDHRDRRLQQEYGHIHPGFRTRALRGWFEAAGLQVEACARVGHDHRSPQLPLLIGLGRRPGSGS
ncbi:MAG: ArsR/SmtB family transcription factor [Planctomycetota bacterium]